MKTHYRKVFKSDHLGVADLEEMIDEKKSLVFTIKEVRQEWGTKVAGRKIDANIAYFIEDIKPMVINAKNSLSIKKFTGSYFVEDWRNIKVSLFVDMSVKNPSTGESGGVGISTVLPKGKEVLNEKHARWSKAKASLKAGEITIEGLRKHFDLSDADAKTIQL